LKHNIQRSPSSRGWPGVMREQGTGMEPNIWGFIIFTDFWNFCERKKFNFYRICNWACCHLYQMFIVSDVIVTIFKADSVYFVITQQIILLYNEPRGLMCVFIFKIYILQDITITFLSHCLMPFSKHISVARSQRSVV